MHYVPASRGKGQAGLITRLHRGLPATCGPAIGACIGPFDAATTGVVPLIVTSLLQIIGGGAGAAGATGCIVTGSIST